VISGNTGKFISQLSVSTGNRYPQYFGILHIIDK
jgi:hypothetical protein